MTHQAPYGWPQPPHFPRHAALPPVLTPPGQRARRAVRLFIAAGIAAAGLCLIVGSVALVAALGRPAGTTTVTSAAQQSSMHRHSPKRSPGQQGTRPSPAPGTTLVAAAGRGPQITGPFTIGGAGSWRLSWSYHSCISPSGPGHFAVSEDADASGVRLSKLGGAGHGEVLASRDAGRHRLVISSDCAWTIRVTQR